jgi:hypothetical protein
MATQTTYSPSLMFQISYVTFVTLLRLYRLRGSFSSGLLEKLVMPDRRAFALTHIVSRDSCGGTLREAKGLWLLIEAEAG